MKIAVFYNLLFSGAKRSVFEHTKGLKSLGHRVDVYTIDDKSDIFDPGKVSSFEYRYKYEQKNINLPIFRKLSHDFSDFYLLKSLHKKIAQDIDKGNYDIVLVHTDRFTQAPFLLRFLKTKSVYFCLEPLKIAYEYPLRIPDDFPPINKIYEMFNIAIRKRIDRNNARDANHCLALSYFGRELMIQAYELYPKVVRLGVDTKLFKKQNLKKKNQVFFVGQKVKINGYNEAKEAIGKIPSKIRPKLVTLSISKDKKLTDRGIVKLYSESIATLSLSNFDTFGLVPLESLACETPVIAYNVAGYRETMIDKKTGYLVDFDTDEIAEKLTSLIKNPLLAQKMGEDGRKWVEENFSWKNQINQLEKLLIEFAK